MLKPHNRRNDLHRPLQPPSGGCVLKLLSEYDQVRLVDQPPSGGCVLKHYQHVWFCCLGFPAAFGRLCVETFDLNPVDKQGVPAAFGRLCVETFAYYAVTLYGKASRLRAAVC